MFYKVVLNTDRDKIVSSELIDSFSNYAMSDLIDQQIRSRGSYWSSFGEDFTVIMDMNWSFSFNHKLLFDEVVKFNRNKNIDIINDI
jgi:hypothetical protein